MEDKKVDIEGLNADMSKFLDQFAPGEIIEKSPAQKINIEEDNELFVVGFNLMCDKENKIKYDIDDLKPYTMVCIDNRQMMECLGMLLGVFKFIDISLGWDKFEGHGHVKYLSIKKIRDLVSKGAVFYEEICDLANKIVEEQDWREYYDYDWHDMEPNKLKYLREKLNNTIRNIWFLPYSEIDRLKEEIKKELGGKNE